MESRNGRSRGWPNARSSRPCLSATMTMRRSRPRRMPGLYGRLPAGYRSATVPAGTGVRFRAAFAAPSLCDGARGGWRPGAGGRGAHAEPDVDGEHEDADEHRERADDRHRHECFISGQREAEPDHEYRQRDVVNPEMDARKPRLCRCRPGVIDDAHDPERRPSQKIDVRMDR